MGGFFGPCGLEESSGLRGSEEISTPIFVFAAFRLLLLVPGPNLPDSHTLACRCSTSCGEVRIVYKKNVSTASNSNLSCGPKGQNFFWECVCVCMCALERAKSLVPIRVAQGGREEEEEEACFGKDAVAS